MSDSLESPRDGTGQSARIIDLDLPAQVTLDEQGRVEAEVPCLACGYLLKGSLPDGQCPECGRAVIDSLRGGVLHSASRGYLESLYSGTTWLIAYLPALVICCVLIFPLLWVAHNPAPMMLVFISSIVWWVAVWKFTEVDTQQGTHPATASTAARVLAFVASLLLFVEMAVAFFGDPFGDEFGVFLLATEMLRTIAVTLGFVFLLRCAVHVARCIPSEGLAIQTKIIAWGIAAAGVVSLLAKGVGIGVLLYQMNWMGPSMAAGIPIPAPLAPATAPASTTTQADGSTVKTWSLTRAGGETVDTELIERADGSQLWTETALDPGGNQLAQWQIEVDPAGDATDLGGTGEVAQLEHLLGPALVNNSVFESNPTNVTVPAPPSRPPDNTQTFGGNTHETWHIQPGMGGIDSYTRMTDASGHVTINETRTVGNAQITTSYQVDPNGTLNSRHMSAWSVTGMMSGAAPFIGFFVVWMIAYFAMIGAGMIWLGGGIWAYVLVFLFRKHIGESLNYARAVHASGPLARASGYGLPTERQ